MESISTVLIVGQFLMLSTMALLGLVIARVIRVDVTLASLLSGMLGSLLVPLLALDTGLRAHNLQDVMFFIVLPLLIFGSAWHINIVQFKRWSFVALLLATVGMLISANLTAVGIFFGIAYDFPWISAFIAGSILALTDPVSVTASLKRLKVSTGLDTLFETESLFNDSTAIVLFSLLIILFSGGLFADGLYAGRGTPGFVAMYFLRTLLGGLIGGTVLGLIAAMLVLFLRDKAAAVVVLVLAAFSSYWLAEYVLNTSGVVTVMAAAIVSRLLLEEHGGDLLDTTSVTWDWLSLYLNALVFSIMGLVITWDMFQHQWLAMLIAIVSVVLARTLAVFTVVALTRLAGREVPWVWTVLLSWGGLKGAIAIVLVLSLPVELPYWWTIQSMVFGVVLFSSMIQATTFSRLFKRLDN